MYFTQTPKPRVFCLWLISIIITLTCHCVNGQWIEATGSAVINSGNTQQARSQAVQNAIKDALLFAGASVSSVQLVSDGLLTQDQFKISSHGSIQQIQLINETHTGDIVNISIRADIIAQNKLCINAEFQKSVAITQFTLNHHEQAKIGSIYEIGKQFSAKLFQAVQQTPTKLLPRPWFKQKLNNHSLFDQYYPTDLSLINAIATSSESQFIVFGRITDISFEEQKSSDYFFWNKNSQQRYFGVEWMIYDTSNQEAIHNAQYEIQGTWDFDLRSQVNVNSMRFWQSNYGRHVAQAVKEVQIAIAEAINCLPLQGKIIQVMDDQIQINLGAQHGIAVGQALTIANRITHITKDGKQLPQFILSPFEVQITKVYQRTAVAQSINGELLGNIQETDFVRIKPLESPSL